MHWNKNDKMDIKWALLKLTQKFVCIKTRIFLHFNASNSKKHARHLKKIQNRGKKIYPCSGIRF